MTTKTSDAHSSGENISGGLYADAVATFSGLFGAPLELDDTEALALPAALGPLGLLTRIPALQEDIEGLVQTCQSFGSAKDCEVELNRAFCLLFSGMGGPMSAPPYESAYMGTGRLFQEPASEMAHLLQEQDLAPAEGFKEPADHLVLELSLLEETIRLAEASGDEQDVTLMLSLQSRLMSWVPAFAKACDFCDKSRFYAVAAKALLALLSQPIPVASDTVAS